MVILLPIEFSGYMLSALMGITIHKADRVMKKSSLVLFLLYSSALANPYIKVNLLMWHFKYKKEKNTFQLVCQPKLTMGSCPKLG